MKVLNGLICLALFLFLSQGLVAHQEGQNNQDNQDKQKKQEKQEKKTDYGYDFEKVEVVNVKVPVRVFHKKKPIGGLKKNDFKIIEDGKEIPINGFFEVRKKLPVETIVPKTREIKIETKPAHTPRFILLIFHITDYNIDLQEGVDTLFNTVLKPGDHLMAITNNYVLHERVIEDPAKEKENLMTIIRKDVREITATRKTVEMELRILARDFFMRLRAGVEPVDIIFMDFTREYLIQLEQFRWELFGSNSDQYVKIAEYLRKKDMEKYVLSFQQLGIFPIPASGLQKTIERFTFGSNEDRKRVTPRGEKTETSDPGSTLRRLGMDFFHSLNKVDTWLSDSTGKLFLNSGATFHTLLMKPRDKTLMDHYEYDVVTTDSENILRQMAVKTGGSLMHSLNVTDFVRDISEKEDIHYVLTYVPTKRKKLTGDENPNEMIAIRNTRTIKVVVKDDNRYKIFYDNQSQSNYIKRMVKKVAHGFSQIKIRKVTISNGILSAVLSGIHLEKDGKEKKVGKVEAHLMVLDGESAVVYDTKKFYSSKKDPGLLQMRHPPFSRGQYNFILEVKDLNTWKTDMNGEMVKF